MHERQLQNFNNSYTEEKKLWNIIKKNWECDFVHRNTLSSLNLVEVQNQLQESQSKQNYFFFFYINKVNKTTLQLTYQLRIKVHVYIKWGSCYDLLFNCFNQALS